MDPAQSHPSTDAGAHFPRSPEPRSFAAPEVYHVGEFVPFNPKGKTDRQILIASLKQSEAAHSCLETHISNFNKFVGEVRLASLDATEKRQELKEDILGLRGDAAEDRDKLQKLTLALGVEKPPPGEKRPRGHSVATWGGWKILGVMGGSISLLVFVVQLIVAAGPSILAYIMSLHP